MANGRGPGRPKAADLGDRRCGGTNHAGGHCGNPVVEGFGHCSHHLGEVDRATQVSTTEKLRKLTDRALDAIADVIENGPPDARVRASKLILDRTVPVSSVTAIVLAEQPAGQPSTALDRVKARMAQLAARMQEPEADDPLIIDAEIVSETVTVVDADAG